MDGQPYGIGVRLRMPQDWNGRFYFQGGGGTDGSLPNSLGNGSPTGEPLVLPLGYAVISTDGGHDNTVNNDPNAGGTAAFGLDPQARVDYGYNALDKVTVFGKRLSPSITGRRCATRISTAARMAGGRGWSPRNASRLFRRHRRRRPGFNLPRAAVAEAWNEQALAPLATRLDANGQPYLPDTFSDADLLLIRNATLAACDGLDGSADGLVDNNNRACRRSRVVPVLRDCNAPARRPTRASAKGRSRRWSGSMPARRDSGGRPLYATRPWDAGINASSAWRVWLLGTPAEPGQPLANNAISARAAAARCP